jgi:uncharacterized membrane protein
MSDWYYAVDNEQKGPINESELKADLAANKIPADTLVWKDGMDGWAPANEVPAFSFRQPPIPAKVQPGVPAVAPAAAKASPEVDNPDSTKPVDLTSLMGKPEALEVDADDADKNKIFGILSYIPIPIPIWWLVGLLAAKESPFAKYHANQGLVLAIVWLALSIVLWFVDGIFASLPSILYFIFTILKLVYIAPLILAIIGIINAAAGKCVPLPFIGGVKLIK